MRMSLFFVVTLVTLSLSCNNLANAKTELDFSSITNAGKSACNGRKKDKFKGSAVRERDKTINDAQATKLEASIKKFKDSGKLKELMANPKSRGLMKRIAKKIKKEMDESGKLFTLGFIPFVVLMILALITVGLIYAFREAQ